MSEVIIALLVLWIIHRAFPGGDAEPPQPASHATPSHRSPASRRDAEDAADAAFFDGVLFSHYFLDDRHREHHADEWSPADDDDEAFDDW